MIYFNILCFFRRILTNHVGLKERKGLHIYIVILYNMNLRNEFYISVTLRNIYIVHVILFSFYKANLFIDSVLSTME